MVQKLLQLLTISRELHPVPLSAAQVCQDAAAGAAGILNSRNTPLELQVTDFPLTGDPDLLQSALQNLIDNASKASQPGQTILLRAEPNRLQVIDHGCGIPAEALPHVTDAFYMADQSRSKRKGGVGLGLALVQEIVSAHRARLTVESTPNTGTTVTILFS